MSEDSHSANIIFLNKLFDNLNGKSKRAPSLKPLKGVSRTSEHKYF